MKKQYILILFLLFSIHLQNTSAQSAVLNKKITLSATNEKLSDVLDKIAEKTGLNLTYNSEIIEINRITTLNAENVSVKEILKEIIRNDMIDYKIISSQLLIHRKRGTPPPRKTTKQNNPSPQPTPDKKSIHKTPEKKQPAAQKDTIISKQDITLLHDQVLDSDTIKRNDTLINNKKMVNNDTIILFSEDKDDYHERLEKGQDILYDSNKYRKFTIIRNDTFYMAEPIKPQGNYITSKILGIQKIKLFNNLQPGLNNPSRYLNTRIFAQGYAGILWPVGSSITTTQQEYKLSAKTIQNAETSLPGFTSGANIGVNINRWTLKTGIAYTRLRNKINLNNRTTVIDTAVSFDYTYDSFWDVFLLESYAEITVNDTTWINIYDSTWVTTTDTTEIIQYDTTVSGLRHKGINRYSYIEIPLMIGYTLPLTDKLSCSFNTGIIAGIFIHANGTTLNPSDQESLIPLSRMPLAKTRFIIPVGLNVHYSLTKQWQGMAGAQYRQSLNSLYTKNHTMSEKINHIGFQAGMVYFF